MTDNIPDHGGTVNFGGSGLPFIGIVCGTVMFIGLPAIVLIYGGHFHWGIQLTIILLAMFCGGLVALTSAFFGTVMPRKVSGGIHGCGHRAGWEGRGKETEETDRGNRDGAN